MNKVNKLVNKWKKYRGAYRILVTTIILLLVSGFIWYQSQHQTVVSINKIKTPKIEGQITVIISGAVNSKGTYLMEEDITLSSALDKIGGVTQQADITKLDLSKILQDGEKIVIPSIQNFFQEEEQTSQDIKAETEKRININTASVTKLQELPGIGQATANKIIEYRKNGYFESIEELKLVSGIGESKFEKIKDYITIDN